MSLEFKVSQIKVNAEEIKIQCDNMIKRIEEFSSSDSKDYGDVMDMEMLYNRMEENLDTIKDVIDNLEEECDE
jgi:hypothetical protein